MGDRQDIDALLVGALYGELDGDDRARLDAHLASHPADRAALDGLRSTRALLRDSNAAATFEVDPPAVISARLLQEAARRAPAPRAGEGLLAWFAGLFRPIASHPALSAAAALVLAVGIGGVLLRKGELKAVQPPGPAISENQSKTLEERAAAPATMGPADSFAVKLDDGRDNLATGSAALPSQPAAQDPAPGRGPVAGEGGADRSGNGAKDRGTRAAATRPAPKGAAAPGLLAIDKQDADAPAMRSLDDEVAADEAAAPAEPAREQDERPAVRAGSTMVGGAQAAPPSIAPAAPAPDPGAATAVQKQEAQVTAWARDQHARMVKLVNAGKCTEAGEIGAAILRKAPEYYAAEVANDRQVRSCQAYIERARRAKAPSPQKSRAGNQQPEARSDDAAESAR